MKQLLIFFILFILPQIACCGIGTIDKRQYVDWDRYPYSNYVNVCSGVGCGTGEFVTPKHILTNKHVAECCGIGEQDKCLISFSNGKIGLAKVVETGGGLSNCEDKDEYTSNGWDWSILELMIVAKQNSDGDIEDYNLNYYHPSFFDIDSTNVGGNLERAGFGSLKVLTNEDIINIKKAYEAWLKIVYPYDFIDRNKEANRGVNFSLGKYWLLKESEDGEQIGKKEYKTFLETFKEITGKDFFNDYLSDGSRLKVIKDCEIKSTDEDFIGHTCEGWHGDSGSAVLNSSFQVVGIHNSGFDVVAWKGDLYNFGVPMHADLQNAIKSLKSSIEIDVEKTKDVPEALEEHDSAVAGETKIGGECISSHLPSHAVSGHYIASGTNKFMCDGAKCSCAATQCEKDFYLVVNSNGSSQGWCYKRNCPKGQHLHIIDGYKTDAKCIADEQSLPAQTLPNIGDECAKEDLPAHAVSGHYIRSGEKQLSCANNTICSCAATRCQNNYYLMVDSKGNSMGWCRSSVCSGGKKINIIDGYKTDGCK